MTCNNELLKETINLDNFLVATVGRGDDVMF